MNDNDNPLDPLNPLGDRLKAKIDLANEIAREIDAFTARRGYQGCRSGGAWALDLLSGDPLRIADCIDNISGSFPDLAARAKDVFLIPAKQRA